MLRSFLACALAAGASAYCFDATGYNCLDWSVAGNTINFNATCGSSIANGLAWCAFGVSLSGTGNMVPGAAFMLTKDNSTSPASVYVEERNLAAYGPPACFATPSIKVLTTAVNADGGVSASWSAPLTGNIPIVNGWSSVISARSDTGPTNTKACNPSLNIHTAAFPRIPIDFFLPPPAL